MASSTQTSPGSMARVRPYRESDLHKLEELFRRNFPDLLLPDLRGESNDLNLVLEDAQGELQMAVVGGLFPAAFPLIDPNARIAEAEREDLSALLAAAEQELREKKIAPASWFCGFLKSNSFGDYSWRVWDSSIIETKPPTRSLSNSP